MMGKASASILATTDSSAACGKRARTRAARSRTSLAAESTLRWETNSTVIWLTSSREMDLMVLMPSIPDKESSSGCVIWLSTTCALAPLYTVRTDTTGASILGYSRTVRRKKEIMPTRIMTKLITVANTGRRIERSDKIMEELFHDGNGGTRAEFLMAFGDDQITGL